MTVQLNGELREVPEGLSLAALIEWLKLPRDRVAVERNLEIVPRARWNVTPLQAGDQLEVVHLVGGGSVVSGQLPVVLRKGGLGLAGCGETLPSCHSEPFAVILSAAKDLALPAQGKLREESRSECFQDNARFLVVPI